MPSTGSRPLMVVSRWGDDECAGSGRSTAPGRDRRTRLGSEPSPRAHELAVEEPVQGQLAVTFEELAPLVGIVTRCDLLRLIARQAAPDAATSQRLRPTPP